VNQRRDHLKGDLMRSLLSFLMGKANTCSAKNKLSRGLHNVQYIYVSIEMVIASIYQC